MNDLLLDLKLLIRDFPADQNLLSHELEFLKNKDSKIESNLNEKIEAITKLQETLQNMEELITDLNRLYNV